MRSPRRFFPYSRSTFSVRVDDRLDFQQQIKSGQKQAKKIAIETLKNPVLLSGSHPKTNGSHNHKYDSRSTTNMPRDTTTGNPKKKLRVILSPHLFSHILSSSAAAASSEFGPGSLSTFGIRSKVTKRLLEMIVW